MAPRTFWKGYLKLSLVTCPVAMTPATTEADRVHLHLLNRETGHRVRSHYVDSVSGAPVESEDQVKGWQSGADEFVVLEDEDLESVGLASTHTIDIEKFVPRSTIDRLWLDGAHYLAPNDPVGEEAFAVIREAMKATGKVGIARLVLARRERHIMLEPRGKGIVVWSLRYSGEIRDEGEVFDGLDRVSPPSENVRLAMELIGRQTGPWDPSALRDPKDAALQALIASKQKGRKAPAPRPTASAPDDGKVVGIMDALRRSLERERGVPGEPAPAAKPRRPGKKADKRA